MQVTDAVESRLWSLRIRFRHTSLGMVPMIEKLVGVLIGLRRLQREGWIADVVTHTCSAADRPAALAAALMSIALVISEHASALAFGELSADELGYARRAFKRATSSVGQRFACAERRSVGGCDSVRVVLSPSTPALLSPGQRTARRTPVSVGSLLEVKGHRYLLDALKMLLDSGNTFALDIVGDGPLRGPSSSRRAISGLQRMSRSGAAWSVRMSR